MRTVQKRVLVGILSLTVSIFLLDGVSHASKSKSKKSVKSSEVKVKVGAHLWPSATSPEPDAEGEAKHEKETKRGIVKKDEFKAKVKIPIDPTSALGIVDEITAQNADVRVILSRAGADVAECRLKFDKIEYEDSDDEDSDDDDDDDDDGNGLQAEYKVEVQLKKGTVRAKKGLCDVNVTNVDGAGNAMIDSGIPDAQAGDVATAILVDSTETAKNPVDRLVDTEFLQGDLMVK